MKIVNLDVKVLSEKWIESVLLTIDQIPDNTVFCMIHHEKKEGRPTFFSREYIKFNSEYFIIKKEIHKTEYDDILFTKRAFYSVTATDFIEKDFSDFHNNYRKAIIEKTKQDSDSYQLSEDDIKAFSFHGIEAKPIMGASWYMKQASRIEYDGVQYAISIHSSEYEENIKHIAHGVNHFEQIKQRHHNLVKDVYNFLKEQKEIGDIWVLIGGGSQIQAFFGNRTGYIGILYLDMDTPSDINNDYLKVIGNEKFTLVANFKENNKYFKSFKNSKIKFIKSN